MARITISMPDNLHSQILKQAKKERNSVSYTAAKLMEIGLAITNNKNKKAEESSQKKISDYCNKLIIQMNGIIKELAVNNFQFGPDKIAKISQDTTTKFNELIINSNTE